VPGGTAERILAKTFASSLQPNSLGTTQSTRPADVPANEDPQGETASGHHVLHAQWGGPAVDGRGRADCQAGQTGFINRLVTDGRWPPSNVRDPLGGTRFGGGNHVVLDPNTPGLAGGTFKARELGIRKVGDVP
jgi:hypothetical protein